MKIFFKKKESAVAFCRQHAKLSKIILMLVVFTAGVCSGFLLFLNLTDRGRAPQQVRQGGYRYINPLVECEVAENMFSQYRRFEGEIKSKISKLMEGRDKSTYAIYFRNLNNGPWFGVNEREKFMPASLLKVPLMMAYLKSAETDEGLLDGEIVAVSDIYPSLRQEIRPSSTIESGEKYRIDDLIYRMIVYSDNNAAQTLLANIPADSINKVYYDLGIDMPGTGGMVNYMSVKSYASFFRILYNAAYLNHEMSEKALAILSKSEYKDALAAGVDPNVEVAHKFGEYGEDANNPEYPYELHDCGIVYYPTYPYLLCIMTRGKTIEENEKTIADISSIFFGEISANYSK